MAKIRKSTKPIKVKGYLTPSQILDMEEKNRVSSISQPMNFKVEPKYKVIQAEMSVDERMLSDGTITDKQIFRELIKRIVQHILPEDVDMVVRKIPGFTIGPNRITYNIRVKILTPDATH